VLLICDRIFPAGVVCDTTHETTASYNVDQDFDSFAILYQEYPTQMLFNDSISKDSGANDKLNFAKARMSGFATTTKSYDVDPDTHRRIVKYSHSSQHLVTLGATNQAIAGMDKNMKRRLLLDYVSALVSESDGGQPHDLDPVVKDALGSNRVAEQCRFDHKEVFTAYTIVETAIKMGAQPELSFTHGKALQDNILTQARKDIGVSITSKGHRNWVMETARILSIQSACFQTLYHPEFCRLYKEGIVERWSPDMFSLCLAPQLYIGKEAVMYALEMLEFLYSSRDENRLLATIALKCCNLANPDEWRYRRKSEGENAMDIGTLDNFSPEIPSH